MMPPGVTCEVTSRRAAARAPSRNSFLPEPTVHLQLTARLFLQLGDLGCDVLAQRRGVVLVHGRQRGGSYVLRQRVELVAIGWSLTVGQNPLRFGPSDLDDAVRQAGEGGPVTLRTAQRSAFGDARSTNGVSGRVSPTAGPCA